MRSGLIKVFFKQTVPYAALSYVTCPVTNWSSSDYQLSVLAGSAFDSRIYAICHKDWRFHSVVFVSLDLTISALP